VLSFHFLMSKIRFQILPPIDRSDEPVSVAGSIPALGDWHPEKSLRLNWKPPFHIGEIEAPARFEYKILRGSWRAGAVDAYGDVPSNFSCEAWVDSTKHHTAADWKDRFRGRLTRDQIRSPVLAGNNELLINQHILIFRYVVAKYNRKGCVKACSCRATILIAPASPWPFGGRDGRIVSGGVTVGRTTGAAGGAGQNQSAFLRNTAL
jgi:hypothetical protein